MDCGRDSSRVHSPPTSHPERSGGSAVGDLQIPRSLHPIEKPSSYRWTICALLFVATTINYVDRQVLGILAPTLQRELAWSESDYGDIVSWFSFAYAFGFLIAGRLMDWI